LAQLLRFDGAKGPQERQICDAICNLIESKNIVAVDSLQASPANCPSTDNIVLSVHDWLESVHKGFGQRFAQAFTRAGYEDMADVSSTSVTDLAKDLRGIANHIQVLGARPPEQRQLNDALRDFLEAVRVEKEEAELRQALAASAAEVDTKQPSDQLVGAVDSCCSGAVEAQMPQSQEMLTEAQALQKFKQAAESDIPLPQPPEPHPLEEATKTCALQSIETPIVVESVQGLEKPLEVQVSHDVKEPTGAQALDFVEMPSEDHAPPCAKEPPQAHTSQGAEEATDPQVSQRVKEVAARPHRADERATVGSSQRVRVLVPA
jgi:hypothetical protein